MENEPKNDEEAGENKLRKQLAAAVRTIQWSYAIFWSLSKNEPGVFEWREGCYNGDIKTMKTVQRSTDAKGDDKIFVERSEQLRELYKSLLEGVTEQQAQKTTSSSPSQTSLLPEDLTDEEWYYLVCMSFVFNHGQCLPGRALAEGKTIWLCYAHHADRKLFFRSLLAKSASIQTVVCFPHLEGVIEIGARDLVPEDPNLLQQIKASILDLSKPVCEDKSSHRTGNNNSDKEADNEVASSFDQEKTCSSPEDVRCDQRENNDEPNPKHKKYNIDSPGDCFKGCNYNHRTKDPQFRRNPLSSSTLVNLSDAHWRESLRFNHSKLSSVNIGADADLHYKRAVTAVLGSSSKLTKRICYEYGYDSSFVAWKKEPQHDYRPPRSQQKMLKEILFTVPFMYYCGPSLESPNKGFGRNFQGKNLESDFSSRDEENFLVLEPIIPSINKYNQETVLGDTIKYLKELEARVGELESCTGSMNHNARTQNKSLNFFEETADSCGKNKTGGEKKIWFNKRKASDISENDPDHHDMVTHGVELKVGVKDQEVLIDMKCPYREYILHDIMDAVNHLHFDSHSFQSSTIDGVFTLTLKCKFQGTAIPPVGMIKLALWKVAGKC